MDIKKANEKQSSKNEKTQEEWRDIVGYEGIYQVSNLGRVKSLGRYVLCKKSNRCNEYKRFIEPRILSNVYDDLGYAHVMLSKNNSPKRMSVHRLVATAFLNNQYNYPIINHKDENPSNNCVDNLEWCTVKYNNEYSDIYEKAYRVTRKPVLQFALNGSFLKEYESTSEAARSVNGDAANISSCCHGRTNSMYGYYWRFKGDTNDKIGNAKLTRVKQCDKDGNVIQIFNRIIDASVQTGISVSSIIDSIRKGTISKNKYKWYKEDEIKLKIPL